MNRPSKYWLFVLVLLAGCYGGEKEAGNVFRYNESSGVASLDPAFAKNQSVMWPIHQLFNTLVETDSALNLVPSLARAWELSPDRRTYTFHLRTDVFFHDDACFPNGTGRRMKASDVAYSLGRIIDQKTASPGAWIFQDKIDSARSFVAVNDSTFELRLLRPYGPILGILSMQYCSVLPREAVARYGNDLRKHPVGTGPFRYVAWEEGQALILKRHPHYFERDAQGRQLPYLDGVRISFYDNKATEFLLFRQGKLDFINDIEASFKDEVLSRRGELRSEWRGRVRLDKHAYLNTEYLGLLVDSTNPLLRAAPTRQRLVRQAINYAIDRRALVRYLRNSIGTPAESGFVPAGLPSFSAEAVKGYVYNPAEARRLLAEAGYGSRPVPALKLQTIPVYAEIGNFIARQLGEVGIPVQVEVVQKSLLLDMTSNGKALFFRGSWIADYPDAENYLSVFYSKNPAPPNYTRYHNPAFDALFEAAIAEPDEAKRDALYRQADALIVRDAPVVPLWYDMVIHLVQPGVEGFPANALNLLELRKVRKTR
ncbi:ABC transporter substrate-binding protein [Flaviaesturariibacter flavus]|uniref:ABC transporter substrate-binding protein n=1 Tax=Flaviaesturariibacter flavus TaxID=2502780 RepID=A0A4R1B3A2_9BACT|nr:ABC transporter substrate-binding protein [Flaviaesturariibacter flavus]TCJ12562.1 ABC transporter substrate-binding protein [Flaviaesturariibacter flavus]